MSSNNSTIVQKTQLFEEHQKYKAKLLTVGEWMVPISYRGVVPEYIAIKKYSGIVDLSNSGKFFVKGEKAQDFLNFLMPQSIDKMADNTVLLGQFTTKEGTILDIGTVYKFSREEFLVLTSSFRITVLEHWFFSHNNNFKIKIENVTKVYSIINLLGKNADEIMKKIFCNDFEIEQNITEKNFLKTKIANEEVFLAKYTSCGEDGCQIIAKNDKIIKIWRLLLEQGKDFRLEPVGIGVCDILRIENGIPTFPNEINESITAIEAGFQNSIDINKKNYLGEKKIISQIKNGTKKNLIGFELSDMTIIPLGTPIFLDKKPIGIVTSCNLSPNTRKAFGMGYIVKKIEPDTLVEINFNKKLHSAKIVNLPFIKKEG